MDRQSMIQKRLLMDKEAFQFSNTHIYDSLKTFVHKDMMIGTYISYRNEADTLHLINDYPNICVPKVEKKEIVFYKISSLKDTEIGTFGVSEPITDTIIPKDNIDIMIIPLLYFNKELYRIGYGGGYYDRYLKDYKGIKIGIAYDYQYNEDIQVYDHDIPLDYIITDKKIYEA